VRVYQYADNLWIADGELLGHQLRTIERTAKKAVGAWQDAAVKRLSATLLKEIRTDTKPIGSRHKLTTTANSAATRRPVSEAAFAFGKTKIP
jgi:hypothetical protein